MLAGKRKVTKLRDWRALYAANVRGRQTIKAAGKGEKREHAKVREDDYAMRRRWFEETRAFVRSLKMKSRAEYLAYAKGHEDMGLPLNPSRHYGGFWVNYRDFLGSSFVEETQGKCSVCLRATAPLKTRCLPLVYRDATRTRTRFARDDEVATMFARVTKCKRCWERNRVRVGD